VISDLTLLAGNLEVSEHSDFSGEGIIPSFTPVKGLFQLFLLFPLNSLFISVRCSLPANHFSLFWLCPAYSWTPAGCCFQIKKGAMCCRVLFPD
jgi:hypothetical protein